MPFLVEHLIGTHQQLVTVRPTDSAQLAYELMNEHDFSQLPVIDDSGKPLGLIKGQSILRAMVNLGEEISKLLVSHAIEKAPEYGIDDDLFDLLRDLRESYAVLIVDAQEKLIGIVTSADTTEYFRRRAEDLMLIEDIETSLKDMILSAFTNNPGEIDQAALCEIISEITDTNKDLRKGFNNGLRNYLRSQGENPANVNEKALEEAFDKSLANKQPPKIFDDLTLFEFTHLLIHQKRWDFINSILRIDRNAILKLLEEVRNTRNQLFHFRSEISSRQRGQLRYCADLFTRHRPPTLGAANLEATAQTHVDAVIEHATGFDDATVNIDEEATNFVEPIESSDSRYARLALWLQNIPLKENTKRLSFDQIESIIGHKLPPSSRHRAWWANDQVRHSHSKLWLEVGWRVAEINLSEEQVLFARIKERGKELDKFFSALHQSLKEKAPFDVKPPKAGGVNHYVISSLPSPSVRLGTLLFYFSRKRKFKTEIYISTGDKETPKKLFDFLYSRRAEIEEEMGEPLNWNRQDNSIASRISIEREVSVTNRDRWEDIRNWAVDAMIRLQKTFFKHVEDFCNLQ
jgi:CBS domain-containing protein